MGCRIKYLNLNKTEVSDIDKLLSEILKKRKTVNLNVFLNQAAIFANDLPKRIRESFYNFKIYQSAEIVIVHGFPIDDNLIGPTPLKHRLPGETEKVNKYEILHILFSTLLGEPFGWTTIQNDYIINNVMPIPEHRNFIASSGSDSLFDLHTEDAFHPCAGDYLGLMCLRNPNKAKTVFSTLLSSDLSKDSLATLFEPRYIVGANVAQSVPAVKELSPILFGNPEFPYIRINLNLTETSESDTAAKRALEELKEILRKNAIKLIFNSSEFCYIDNYRVVHGREPFTPNYNGKDRWLKRLYITSSFRHSIAFRNSPEGRILNPSAINWKWNK